MTSKQRKQILAETIEKFKRKEWFRGAVVHDAWPTSGEPTLELRVNYLPLFERKEIKDFALAVNLTERYTVIDKNGKPVE